MQMKRRQILSLAIAMAIALLASCAPATTRNTNTYVYEESAQEVFDTAIRIGENLDVPSIYEKMRIFVRSEYSLVLQWHMTPDNYAAFQLLAPPGSPNTQPVTLTINSIAGSGEATHVTYDATPYNGRVAIDIITRLVTEMNEALTLLEVQE